MAKIKIRLKRLLTENKAIKILSVIIAALLWFFIMNVEDPVVSETFYDIPVKVVNESVVTDKGYQYSIESGDKVDIKVEGKRSIVDSLSESDLEATADFNTLSNVYLATIVPACPKYGEDELLLTAKTESMSIKLEDSAEQAFNLHIVHEGNVKEGYFAYDTTGVSLIQVTGAVSQIAKIKEIAVYIDVEGKKESFEIEATPMAIDMDGNAIDPMKLTFSQNTVNIKVGIYPTKEVGVEVITEGEPADGFAATGINYAPSTALIAGEPGDLDRINKVQIVCDITGKDATIEQSFDLETVLEERYGGAYHSIDEDLQVAAVVPVEKLEHTTLMVSLDDIEAKNLPEGYSISQYSIEPVKLDVYTTAEQLFTVKASDLKLYIDFQSCKPGTERYEIKSTATGALRIGAADMVVIVRKNE